MSDRIQELSDEELENITGGGCNNGKKPLSKRLMPYNDTYTVVQGDTIEKIAAKASKKHGYEITPQEICSVNQATLPNPGVIPAPGSTINIPLFQFI